MKQNFILRGRITEDGRFEQTLTVYPHPLWPTAGVQITPCKVISMPAGFGHSHPLAEDLPGQSNYNRTTQRYAVWQTARQLLTLRGVEEADILRCGFAVFSNLANLDPLERHEISSDTIDEIVFGLFDLDSGGVSATLPADSKVDCDPT